MPHSETQQGSTSGTITYTDDTGGVKVPKESRRAKIAADFAYTLNHAIVCTLTDPVTDVPIGATVQNMLAGMRGEGDKYTWEKFREEIKPTSIWESVKKTFGDRKELKSWFAGEFAGDFGAVAAVVAIQNLAPWLGKGIQKVVGPVMGPIFRHSAERAARKEFEFAKTEAKGPEFQQRVEEIYNREIERLPNAVLWTVASPAINITMQKLVMKNDAPVADLLIAKAIGATVTSSLTLGLRSLSPEKAQRWDDWVSSKASEPIAGVVSKVAGIDKDELKKEMQEREDHEHGRKPHGKASPKETTMEEKYGKKASNRTNVAWAHRVENEEKENTKSQYGLAS